MIEGMLDECVDMGFSSRSRVLRILVDPADYTLSVYFENDACALIPEGGAIPLYIGHSRV
jgi:hypothetical protein